MTVHPGAADSSNEHVIGVPSENSRSPLHRCGEGADLLVVGDEKQVRTASAQLPASRGYVRGLASIVQKAPGLLTTHTYPSALIRKAAPDP